MKTIRCSLLAGLVLLVCATTNFAQFNSTPPSFCCQTFTFGEAKAHNHDGEALLWYYGTFTDNGRVPDPTDNTGNFFFGNTIHVRAWGPIKVFWYDWSADLLSPVKLSVWKSSPPFTDPLTVRYYQLCMLATSVTSPHFP